MPRCKHRFRFQALVAGEDTLDEAVLCTQKGAPRRKRDGQDPSHRRLPSALGRYVPKAQLGEGGFGVVYRAVDPVLSRDVAIKLPHAVRTGSGSSSSQKVKERFAKDARAAAKLRHPNIVAVFDHGFCDEGSYIVYEFVPGRTLDDVRSDREQPIPQPKLIQWVATLADALAYAASEGIVHRDIKPANIMIDSHDRPQIMDFGLAVALQQGKAQTGGQIAGTPVYMSPEKGRGEAHIGPAADQYSLAAILYQLTTGVRPVQRSGVAALAEVAEREGPPLKPLKSLSRDLRAIIVKAMHRDPEVRIEEAGVAGVDLPKPGACFGPPQFRKIGNRDTRR